MGGLGKARIPSKKKPKNGTGGTLRLIALQIDELGVCVFRSRRILRELDVFTGFQYHPLPGNRAGFRMEDLIGEDLVAGIRRLCIDIVVFVLESFHDETQGPSGNLYRRGSFKINNPG